MNHISHTLHIPYENSTEKISQFLPTAQQPMPVLKHRWPKGNLQLLVKPWRGKPYAYWLTCQVAEKLPAKEYRHLYHEGRQLYATITPNGDKYDIEITDEVPSQERQRLMLRDVWKRMNQKAPCSQSVAGCG